MIICKLPLLTEDFFRLSNHFIYTNPPFLGAYRKSPLHARGSAPNEADGHQLLMIILCTLGSEIESLVSIRGLFQTWKMTAGAGRHQSVYVDLQHKDGQVT